MQKQSNNDLAKLWDQMEQPIIKGKLHEYRINRKKYLGRGGFGIVYQGICKITPKDKKQAATFQQVAMKQFKKSQKWRNQEDFDKQVVVFEKYSKYLDQKYVLEVIDLFRQKNSQKYYLVTPLAKEGNLCERFKDINEQQTIYKFALRLASIIKYLHNDALSGYRTRQKGEQEKNQKVSIIHRDVKPHNIIFLTKEIDSLYLVDFGIAKVGYNQMPKPYNNCGTVYYKAPQVGEGRIYNSKVDVYGFGSTLFQVLNDGEKLMTTQGSSTRYGDRDRFIKGRLVELNIKLLKNKKKINNPNAWIQLLHNCLLYEVKKRYSSQKVYNQLINWKFQVIPSQKLFFNDVTEKQREIKQRKQLYQINYQVFRLSFIQNTIFSIFQYIYFQQSRINKFTLYVLLRLILIFFIDRYNRLKERFKNIEKPQKYNQIKNMIQQKKILELYPKTLQKIKKQISKQENSNRIQNRKTTGPCLEMVRRFPQILFNVVAQPKRTLFEFCYQKRSQLLQHEKFAKYIMIIVSLMEDIDSNEQMKVDNSTLEGNDIQALSLRNLDILKKAIDERMSKEGIKAKLQNCRVQFTVKSHINREENKTDIQIQKYDR